MKHPPPLEHDKYYHIYNRGINSCTLFREHDNFERFIRLYNEYIPPIAETFAWVLMKNHFHFLVRILSEDEIGYMKPKEDKKHIIYPKKKKYNPTQQFGNLFNAYAKSYNKKYKRTGSLFESPFRRIHVNDDTYFKQLVFYIHNNPVHHGLCNNMADYPWSSYLSIISVKSEHPACNNVIGWFNSQSEFIEFHQGKQDGKVVEKMMKEDNF